jgi:RpiR family carbohydrate utilization transcriptional regulator
MAKRSVTGPHEQHPKVLAWVRSLAPSLSPSEGAVARFVLANPSLPVHLGIEEFARRAGVSTASITRFCQRLGLNGFKDFKLALASDVAHSVAALPQDINASDSPIEIARKVFLADQQAIQETLSLLDEGVFTRMVEMLEAAAQIQVYGVGSSAPIADDAYYRFLRIGLPAHVVTDSHMQAVSAALLGHGNVAFVISHTGRTSETLAAARNAKASGATVLGLTSFMNTPLTEMADECLITATGETAFRVEAMASRIAHLSVIDALYVALAVRRGREALDALERTGKVIEEKRW